MGNSVRESRSLHLLNLGPGRYVFQIQAQGENLESWGPVTSAPFVIAPFFYQTLWFRLLLVVLALGVIALLFRIQLRRANSRLRERIEARMLERERIARELHDTLLQGLQGLMFHFQAVAAQIPSTERAATMMENVLKQADSILIESRDRVAELRDSPRETSGLPDMLVEVANHLKASRELEVETTVLGEVHPLDATVNAEIVLIAREALSNAIRHAQASLINITLSYERSGLRLTVKDDGRGISEEILKAGGREGHFGLRGMHERARRLRGGLRITNQSPQGTLVELRVPASMAYGSSL